MLRIEFNEYVDGDFGVSIYAHAVDSEIAQFQFRKDDPNLNHNYRQIQELVYAVNGPTSDMTLLGPERPWP